MRIIFLGTPEFARKSLKHLYEQGHDIAAVFTGSDKAKNRGMKLSSSPVKELALSNGTLVYEHVDLTAELVRSLKCDLIAVVAYGKILSGEVLEIPPLGCVNIHGSILPKYRGAAPIQHAIINGEKETGVSSMYISEKMDEGDVIFTQTTPIGPDETSADLFERLGSMGAELLGKAISAIGQGKAPRTPQNHAEATYAPMLTKEMSRIDFNTYAYEIKNKVRGLMPWPFATMELGGKTVKVYDVIITKNQTGESPGTILTASKIGIEAACKDGTVIITKLQAPGGKVISAADYVRGNKIL